MQKDNEKAVSEMKSLAESFEKEVTEEGELEPSARCACFQHLPDMHSLIPPQQGLPALTAFNVGAYPRPRAVSMCRVCRALAGPIHPWCLIM